MLLSEILVRRSLQLGIDTVSASDHVRVLGITFSCDLSLEKHVSNVCSTHNRTVSASRRVMTTFQTTVSNIHWKHFSLVDIDVPSAVEVFTTRRYINVHLLTYLLTYHISMQSILRSQTYPVSTTIILPCRSCFVPNCAILGDTCDLLTTALRRAIQARKNWLSAQKQIHKTHFGKSWQTAITHDSQNSQQSQIPVTCLECWVFTSQLRVLCSTSKM